MKKGQKNERRAAKLYERAGYETFRPPRARGGPTDIFELFDILAMRTPQGPARLVQIKSNRAEGIRGWSEEALRYHLESIEVEMLVRYDGEPGPHTPGPRWRLIQPRIDAPNRYETLVDERETGGRDGDGIVKYLNEKRA